MGLDEKIRWFIYYYNKGLRKKDIAEKLGIAKSTLSTYIRKALDSGIMEEYYYIPIEKLPYPVIMHLYRAEQRIGFSKCIGTEKADMVLYILHPTPHYLVFSMGSDERLPVELSPYCKLLMEHEIEKTITLDQSPLDDTLHVSDYPEYTVYDEIDEIVMRHLYIATMPPGYILPLRSLKRLFAGLIPTGTLLYHYTRHMANKLIIRRYVYVKKPWSSRFCIIHIASSSFARALTIVELLYNVGIITAIYFIHVLSWDPSIIWIVGKCGHDEVSDPNIMHNPVDETFYEIYFMDKLKP